MEDLIKTTIQSVMNVINDDVEDSVKSIKSVAMSHLGVSDHNKITGDSYEESEGSAEELLSRSIEESSDLNNVIPGFKGEISKRIGLLMDGIRGQLGDRATDVISEMES